MDKEWFRKNCYWTSIIGVAIIAFLVYLGCKHGIAISFALLSILVATFFASRSLRLTRDSLALTRATQRPFLNIAKPRLDIDRGQVKGVGAIACNNGNLPADRITIDFELFAKENKDSNEQILGKDLQFLSLFFPGQETDILYNIEKPEHSKLITDGKSGFRVTINYHHKLAEKGCKTIRTYSIIKIEEVLQFSPVSNEDYWD